MTEPAAAVAEESTADGTANAAKKHSPARRIVSGVISLLIVGGIFFFAIPKVADYSAVWKAFESLTGLELLSLIAATVFNLFTYWWANMAALPGLRLSRAAVLTQTTTSVANTLPGGGAIAVGLTYTILKSWGFTGTDVALYVGVTGIWNIFVKLALPVISLVFLVIAGESGSAYVVAAVVGVIVLAIAVGLLSALFVSERFARRIGDGFGRILSFFLKLFGKPARTDSGDRAVMFRADTIGLVERRWVRLTLTTILSQVALYLVLLLSLRNMGVSEQDVSAAQVFAVFSFSRLLTAVPITPGGVGVIDLGYIGGLAAAAPDGEKAAIVAAVLMFRALTYGIQIPLGAFTYLIWKAKKDWRRESPSDAEQQASPA
ncbi:MAG TPA: lysylphosphatidylglycerol synthase transmembrane domain-containing protein [Actinomycetota bacterium]|nr:lysylphosphatidylglycerol synthase transmembrane domain-containing protein [Actinomycetota bacterium]